MYHPRALTIPKERQSNILYGSIALALHSKKQDTRSHNYVLAAAGYGELRAKNAFFHLINTVSHIQKWCLFSKINPNVRLYFVYIFLLALIDNFSHLVIAIRIHTS